jgi:hypothetical protein
MSIGVVDLEGSADRGGQLSFHTSVCFNQD